MEVTKPSTPTKRVPGGKGGRKGRGAEVDSDESLAYAALKASSTHSSSFERQGRYSVLSGVSLPRLPVVKI